MRVRLCQSVCVDSLEYILCYQISFKTNYYPTCLPLQLIVASGTTAILDTLALSLAEAGGKNSE